jgi:CBS domain-containing protein
METNSFKNWLTLEEIVDRAPLQVTPNTSVLEAIALMSGKQGEGCVLVVDGTQLVGIFTEPDVVRLMGAGTNLSQTKIQQARFNG